MKRDAHPMLALVRERANELLPYNSWIVSPPGSSLTAKFRPKSTSPALSVSGLEVDAQFWVKRPFKEVTFEFAGDSGRKEERERLAAHFRGYLAAKDAPRDVLISAGSTICRLPLSKELNPAMVDDFIEFVHANLSAWCHNKLPALSKNSAVGEKKGIPPGVTRAHVLNAIREFDSGITHPFKPSTGYDLVFRENLYPPKAILGIASARVKGSPIGPDDFNSGEPTFRILRQLGFVVQPKRKGTLFPDEVNNEPHFEGAVTQVKVNRYERDPRARKKCISHFGPICQVCKFDFGKKFGAIGKGFIHVHHLVPLSEIRKGYVVDPVKHLRPICPNCHAMVHRRSPPYEMEEIKRLRAAQIRA